MILVENRIALGFAHFLQNHLLGRLRRNPPQHVGRLGRYNLCPDFRRRILFLRLCQADLFFRVGHFLDNHMHRVHVHLACFLVELRAQILFRLVILPRRHHHGVFNRRHYHFRLDVLLAAQHLDLLVEQIRHVLSLKSPLSNPLSSLRAPLGPCRTFCAPQRPRRLCLSLVLRLLLSTFNSV